MPEIKLEIAEKVAQACRILAKNGHTDLNLGHVTVREPGSQEIYMKCAGKGLNEIQAEDIIMIDMDGRKIAGDRRCHNETPIHTEIFRARPEINCVIHTHPFYATVFSASRRKIRALSHEGILFQDIPLFEETCTLIVKKEQGQSLARTIGSSKAMLLRNHGIVVAGETIAEAVVLAVSLEKAAMAEIFAVPFGDVTCTPQEEIPVLIQQAYDLRHMETYWEYLVRDCS